MGEYEKIRKSIDSYCGLSCAGCSFREEQNCGGCIATEGHPFHGACQVAACAVKKQRGFCGECAEFPCGLLKSFSEDEVYGDTPKGARIERCAELKAAMVYEARKGVDPISVCGHHCDHCFLGQWCGGCRSVYPGCSFATLFEDKQCPNVTCAAEKGLDGCWECSDVESCTRGYFGQEDGYTAKGAALFLKTYGKKAYTAAHVGAEASGAKFPGESRTPEEAKAFLEFYLREEQEKKESCR